MEIKGIRMILPAKKIALCTPNETSPYLPLDLFLKVKVTLFLNHHLNVLKDRDILGDANQVFVQSANSKLMCYFLLSKFCRTRQIVH